MDAELAALGKSDADVERVLNEVRGAAPQDPVAFDQLLEDLAAGAAVRMPLEFAKPERRSSAPPPPRPASAPAPSPVELDLRSREVVVDMSFEEGAYDSAPAPAPEAMAKRPSSVPPPAPRESTSEVNIEAMFDDVMDEGTGSEAMELLADIPADPAEVRVGPRSDISELSPVAAAADADDAGATSEHALPESDVDDDFEFLGEDEFEELDVDVLEEEDV